MLKQKEHRVSKKRFLIPSFLLLLFAAIAGTIAFYTDSATFNNLFHVADHIATHTEEFVSPSGWKTCDEVPKTLVTTNESTHNIYVRLRYDEFWRNKEDNANLPLVKDNLRLAIINFQNEDNWELKEDGWYYWKGSLVPGDSTLSLFKSVTLNCQSNLTLDNICQETATGTVCEKPEDTYEEAKYHLKITVQTSDDPGGFVDNTCKLTVNPNGGTYGGSSEVYEQDAICGSTIDLLNTSRTDYELTSWTKSVAEEEDSTLPANTTNITLDKDTTLTANWLSTIRYNVTVDPNGGSYDNSTSPSSYQARKDTTYTLGEATNTGYFVDYWEVVSGTVDTAVDGRLTSDAFVVTSDVVLRAHWDKAVARIERTQKIYPSIMRAEAEAQSEDIITLLVDTEEVVTNEKKVTLDLNNHTVTGSLTNTTAGNLTIINGEINNPDGAAVTNNGILTLGVNDYDDEGVANVINDNVRLIGTTAGLMQTNNTYQLYYYDGYLEGDLGLVGGYNGSPFYRRAYDGVEVHYFPFVEHREQGERNYQHVELKNADNAVTKTSVHGDIYYYNVQDNIDVSAITGYKIYAVRNFDASYPITISSGDNIDIDIAGYIVDVGDNITINGQLQICNSKDTGSLRVSVTITNNNILNFCDITVEALNANTVMNNKNTLNMTNSTIQSSYGHVLLVDTNNTTLNMDDDSYLKTDSNNATTVYITSAEFTIGSGHIVGKRNAITIKTSYEVRPTITVTGGTIEGTYLSNNYCSSSDSTIYGDGWYSYYMTISGGLIKSGSCPGVYGANITMTGGKIQSDSGSYSSEANGIAESDLTISGGTIEATGSQAASAIRGGSIHMSGGTITATSSNGSAYGVSRGKNINIASGTITANGKNEVYGILQGWEYSSTSITGGTISATATDGTAYGYSAYDGRGNVSNITGGSIYGSSYGVANDTVTIGLNDDNISITQPEIRGDSYALYNASIYYYDGILKGGIKAYPDDVIEAIPDGAIPHIETIDGLENCWLVEDEPYLEVNGVQYNSLTKAYNAAASGDTIKVIRDFTSSALLPDSPSNKELTLDLNNHSLEYAQPLVNRGTLHVVDNSTAKGGSITNTNSLATITTYGPLSISSGRISGNRNVIVAPSGGRPTITITGGTIESTYLATGHSYNGCNGSISTIYGDTYSVAISDGLVKTGSCPGIYGASAVTMTGGKIQSNSGSAPDATSIAESNLTISGGIIEAISEQDATAIRGGSIHMSGGTITATSSNGSAYGVLRGGNINIASGTITANGKNEVYGILQGGEYSSTSITGGTISATSTDGTAYGYSAYSGRGNTTSITGGSIYGSSYGVGNGNITIGTNDGSIDATQPIIRGDSYALYNGNMYVYDGIFKSITGFHYDRNIKAIADDSTFAAGSETIDGKNYTTHYLAAEHDVARIGTTNYTSLPKAITAANSTDTIELLEDIYIYGNLTIPSTKTATIDLNGYNITTSLPIINNGNIKLQNSGQSQILTYTDSDYLIHNTASGSLEIVSIPLSAPNVIDNAGNLTLDGASVSSTSTSGYAINNSGNMTVKNHSTINAQNYAINHTGTTLSISSSTVTGGMSYYYGYALSIYNSSAQVTIEESEIKVPNTAYTAISQKSGGTTIINKSTITGNIDNTSGDFSIASSTIQRASVDYSLISNRGSMTIDKTNITGVPTSTNALINNTGTMSLQNLTTITSENQNISSAYNIVGNSGTLTYANTTIVANMPANNNYSSVRGLYNTGTLSFASGSILVNSYNSYGIYSNDGTTTILSGTINAAGTNSSYGIYIPGGEVTLGEAEPTTSPNYGTANANVSTTAPAITAIGTNTGIGVKKTEGRFNYYDGIITGSTEAKPELPTKIEYLYEAKNYTDDNNHQYCILEFMRNS